MRYAAVNLIAARALCLALLLTLLPTTASAAAKIYNVVDKPIVTGSGNMPSLSQVEAILRAAAEAKRWVVTKVDDGHLQAEQQVRSHWASFDITFTRSSWTIKYRDSSNLDYKGGRIHRNYNKWIKLVERIADQRFQAI